MIMDAIPRGGRAAAKIVVSSIVCLAITISQISTARGESNVEGDGPQQQWTEFIAKIRKLAEESYIASAYEMDISARQAQLNSERTDLGLSLSAGYTDYPDGLGGGTSNNNIENLDQYSDVRLNFDLLDQLVRKSSRVDEAKARVRQAKHQLNQQRELAAIEFARSAAIAWAEKRQYQALTHALEDIQRAKRRLKLSATASMPEITEATLQNEAEALILHSEITSAFDGLSPFAPTTPPVPDDYTVLPQRAPGSDDIVRVANESHEAKLLEAQAEALREQSQSLRANGIDLSVFAGHVFQERNINNSADREDGPMYGVTLTIPLGANQYFESRSLNIESQARDQEAADALLRRQKSLIQLRNDWSKSVAALSRSIERMRQQSRLLKQMRQRASQPASGQAPHPWQVDIESAKFWLRVANTWEERGRWMSSLLAWSVIEPDYLVGRFTESHFKADNAICAPIYEC